MAIVYVEICSLKFSAFSEGLRDQYHTKLKKQG